VLTIDKTQQVFLGDKQVNIHELPQMLRQQGSDPAHQIIYLRADEACPLACLPS
jgi:biopolymer transport protein TolR